MIELYVFGVICYLLGWILSPDYIIDFFARYKKEEVLPKIGNTYATKINGDPWQKKLVVLVHDVKNGYVKYAFTDSPTTTSSLPINCFNSVYEQV